MGLENKRKLRASLELRHYRGCLLLYSIAMAAGVVLAVVTGGGVRDATVWILAAVIFAVCFGPFLCYYLWRIFRMYRQADQYIFCRVKLSQPHHSRYLRTMYFIVIVEDPAVGRIAVNTRPIFFTHGIIGPLLEDYVNHTVTIGYNLETEEVVVIG